MTKKNGTTKVLGILVAAIVLLGFFGGTVLYVSDIGATAEAAHKKIDAVKATQEVVNENIKEDLAEIKHDVRSLREHFSLPAKKK